MKPIRNNNLTIMKVITSSIINLRNKSNRINIQFPNIIGKYRFVKEIFKKRVHRPYRFGLYINNVGKKAIAKQWCGKRKDFDYYSLHNEIKVYKVIYQLYKRKENEIIKKFPNIHIPNLIKVIDTDNRLLLFIEKINNKTINYFNINTRIEIYEKLIDYFNFLYKQLDNTDRDILDKRKMLNMIFISPLILLKTIITYPFILPSILRATGILITLLPILLKEKKMSFIQKSLEDSNILYDGKNIYIIDFQLSVIAHPIFEIVQIMIFSWKDKKFIKAFYNSKTVKRVLDNPTTLSVYQGLAIIAILIQIAMGEPSEFKTNYSFLKHIINLLNEINEHIWSFNLIRNLN